MTAKTDAVMRLRDAGVGDHMIAKKLAMEVRIVRRIITMEVARRASPGQLADGALGRHGRGLPTGHLKPWPAQTAMFADFKAGQAFGRVERPAPDYTLGGVA